jgi:hypothetical protein
MTTAIIGTEGLGSAIAIDADANRGVNESDLRCHRMG